MGPLGVQETVFIFVLALLIFGPKKLPELGKTIGKAMSEFRRASSELRATFDREMNAIERENESLKDVTKQYALEDHSTEAATDNSSDGVPHCAQAVLFHRCAGDVAADRTADCFNNDADDVHRFGLLFCSRLLVRDWDTAKKKTAIARIGLASAAK